MKRNSSGNFYVFGVDFMFFFRFEPNKQQMIETRDHLSLREMARQTLSALPWPLPVRSRPVAVELDSARLKTVPLCDQILQWADQRRWWLWTTVLVFYAAAFNGQWRIQPDSALYLAIGRNLAEGRGYTFLGKINLLAYPGWPCVIAVVFKLFGSASLVAINAVATLIALATVAMVYRLVLLHRGRPTAVVVAFGVALTKAFFLYGFELWSDMPFALGVMTFLAGYEGVLKPSRKHALDWSFIVLGLVTAMTMRPTGWPLLLATVAALAVDVCRGRINFRKLTFLCGTIAFLAASFFLVAHLRKSHLNFGSVYQQYVLKRVTGNGMAGLAALILGNLHGLFTWAASDVLFQVRFGPYLNTLLSAVVLLLGFALFRFRLLWGFWFCLLLGTILLAQETLDRYFLPVLPLLIFSWWEALREVNRRFHGPWGNLAFLGLLGFGAVVNVTKVTGIIIQQRERPVLAGYDKGRYDAVPQFAKSLHDRVGDDAIVLARAPYGRVLAFCSRRYVTSAIETPVLDARTYPLYVVEPADPATHTLLNSAGLVEGPALFTVRPTTTAGEFAVPLSLHGTHLKS